ncbi:RDD family protein [Salipaludibacillus sp. HK11]|uniref:RDD family protein n=1 Tax=Salipaludibacillus sp. HK11 TaxID=3394320 RepID=UPI0039FD5B54
MSMSGEKISVKTPEYVSLQFESAGLGSRSVAFIIDQAILMVVNILIVVMIFFSMEQMEAFFMMFDSPMVPIAIAIVLIFVINNGYFFVLEYFTGGRTIGKKVIGIRVIQENGHSITLLSSFIRNFLRIVDSLPASHLLGIIMIFAYPKHKRLGDLAAGSIVVHEKGRLKGKKLSKLEKEIANRNITKDNLSLDEWSLNALGSKEWQLLKAYSERFTQLPMAESESLTSEVASVLLVKVGIELEGSTVTDKENMLLALYLHMKDEWDYQL